MTGFIFILIAAAAAHGIAAMLRLPVIPLYLIAGAIANRLMGNEAAGDAWITAVELGLMFLVFSVGVELNPNRINKQIRPVWMVGLFQFGLLGLCGYLLANILGYSQVEAVYITFALSASSTLVVVRLLKQRQQMFEPYGRLVSGVLLLQDVFIILILVVLLRLEGGPAAMLLGAVQAITLALLAWLGHRYLASALVVRLKQDEETLLLTILAVLFAFLGLAWLLDLPLAVGAFMGGFVLSVFPVNGITRGMISSLSGFFLALFFTALGALITVPNTEMWWHVLIFAVFLVLITVPLVTFIGEYNGISAKSAIESGLLLSQTSEFSLILVLQGWLLMQISHELFSMVAILTVGTMALTPMLSHERVAHFLMRWHPLIGRGWKLPPTLCNHIVMLGYGSAGDYISVPVHESGFPVVVVDDDAVVIRHVQRQGVHALRGDAAESGILKKVCASDASLIIVTVRRFRDVQAIMDELSSCAGRIWVRVFDADQAAYVKARGGTAIVGADEAADKFHDWLSEHLDNHAPEEIRP